MNLQIFLRVTCHGHDGNNSHVEALCVDTEILTPWHRAALSALPEWVVESLGESLASNVALSLQRNGV